MAELKTSTFQNVASLSITIPFANPQKFLSFFILLPCHQHLNVICEATNADFITLCSNMWVNQFYTFFKVKVLFSSFGRETATISSAL
jgi:hypothetical protein